MKVIIVLFHTLFAFSMLLSFPTVECWLGKVYWSGERLNMTQNDPLLIPTQSKLVEKDDGISAKVADKKGKIIGRRSSYRALSIKRNDLFRYCYIYHCFHLRSLFRRGNAM